MFFVKSCHREDNVHTRKTIRIGTLDEYRSTEQLQIVDQNEGTFHFELDLTEIHIQRNLLNYMNYNHNSFVSFIGDEVFIGGPSHVLLDGIHLHRYKMSIRMKNTNRFIFCMSRVDNYDDAKGIFPHYDDKWFFNQSKAILIAQEIGSQLNKQIMSKEKSGIRVFEGDYDIERVFPRILIQTIDYKDRVITVDNEFFYSNLNDMLNAMSGASFIKPRHYAHEKEVRFIFDYYFYNQLLSPAIKSIIVPMREETLPLLK